MFQVLFACLLSPQRLWVLGSGEPVLLRCDSGSLQGAELHKWVCVRPWKPARSAFLPDCPHPASQGLARSQSPAHPYHLAFPAGPLRPAFLSLPDCVERAQKGARGAAQDCGFAGQECSQGRHALLWLAPQSQALPGDVMAVSPALLLTDRLVVAVLPCFCDCRLNWSTVPPC